MTRLEELERELLDYKEGRRYSGGHPEHVTPIDRLARMCHEVADALRITDEEWRRGWNAGQEIERLRRGERK